MIRLIVTVVLIVLLAILVAFNLRFTTTISLYGIQFADVPAMAVALVSFALGVVYSLFLYVGRYLHGKSRQRLDERRKDVARREQELSGQAAAASPPSKAAAESSPGAGGDVAQAPTPRARMRLFRRGPRGS